MQRWRVGDVVVTKLVELELAGKATWILPDATRENLLRDRLAAAPLREREGQRADERARAS